MPNEEVLGPRKTMFVLVIVVGCFAVLWPRILSPLILGHSRDQLKPNAFDREAAVKQERPPIRAGPHPALRERGRAIPPGAAPARPATPMPPHVRVRSSPLSVYYELDIKPPPIPGMRPPLGSPGGPVPTPKSSMGFVMPIYTICIIVFFVYTLSKILFKRSASPYEPVSPDPNFRRRVFRQESRTTPDKLGPKERDTIVTAISGLVAEVQQQMEASYAQNHQRQEAQEEQARPYTNGTILHNTGPVHIVASEYQETKEKTPEPQKEATPEPVPQVKEPSPEKPVETKEALETKEPVSEKVKDATEVPEVYEIPETASAEQPAESKAVLDDKIPTPEENDLIISADNKEVDNEVEKSAKPFDDIEHAEDREESGSEPELIELNNKEDELIKLTSDSEVENDAYVKVVEDFLNEESKVAEEKKQSTPDLLEEAIKEESPDKSEDDQENATVRVVGMEVTAHTVDGGAVPRAPPPATSPPAPQRPHEATEVKSIYLETEIPQKSRVLVTDFKEDRPEESAPTANSPMVVSGKMTLSLIQDAPRDTPEKDQESTVDDFTTASALTQPAADKQADEESGEEEEIEEEIEVEEIEEEVEDEEIEEIEEDESEEDEPVKVNDAVKVTQSVDKVAKEAAKIHKPEDREVTEELDDTEEEKPVKEQKKAKDDKE